MSNDLNKPTSEGSPAEAATAGDRRDFLTTVTTVGMVGGLAAGYGTFFALAGQFLYPTSNDRAWLFVSTVDAIAPGDSLAFESPGGVKVVIKRQAEAGAGPVVDQFIALSSVCPHLGCRVHWEGHNNRFFCPCHNGEFDPTGNPTGGPPLAAHQHLPRYPLQVEGGMLFIEMPVGGIGGQEERLDRPQGASIAQCPRRGAEQGDEQWG